ncbi:MAG: hypothetical protein U0892_09680 [Pirellulales bacterium]
MNRLQLATLLSWAGQDGLSGRKRLQKVVYLLQEAVVTFNAAASCSTISAPIHEMLLTHVTKWSLRACWTS